MPATTAASFNGSSTYLFRSNFTGNPSAFTVSQWVFLNAAQSARTFFGNSASPTGTGWATGISDTTSNVVKFYLGSNTLSGATTLPAGTWAFVVCTYDGTTARIYLNGSTTADASLASAINYGTVPGGNYVGQASDSSQFLNGSLAALGYWSRALSGTEAASLYNGGKGMAYADLTGSLLTSLVDYYDFADASSLGLDSAPAGNTLADVGAAKTNGPDAGYDAVILAESGLVGYWKLDETSGTMALDSVGTHNGTYSGGYTLGQVGVSDTAVKFDGTGNVATSAITSGLPTGTGPVTIETWFKVNSYVGSGYTDICGYGAYSTNQAMWLGFYGDGSTVYVQFYNTIVTVATLGYNDGLYHHLVVSYDGATANLYFDGSLVKTQAVTLNLAYGGKPFTIGSGYSGNNKINGTMDGVAVYNTSLSAARVAAHYAIYGLGHFGTGTGGRTSGDGLDATFNFGTTNPLVGSPNQYMMACCWINVATWVTTGQSFFSQVSGSNGWTLQRSGTGRGVDFTMPGIGGSAATGTSVLTGGWVHVAGLFDITGFAYLYINGVNVSNCGGAGGNVFASGNPLALGIPGANIAVAEPALYRNLTHAQGNTIAANLAAGRSPMAQTPSPVFYSRFGSGSTETDLVGGLTSTMPSNSFAVQGPTVDAPIMPPLALYHYRRRRVG